MKLTQSATRTRYLWVLLFLLVPGAATIYVWMHDRTPESRMRYWQRQAAAVHVGMTRREAEKLVPQPSYDGLLWGLENLRSKYARGLPPLRHAPEFEMTHSNDWNLLGYEVAEGVFIVIRYDLSGYPPGPPIPGKSTLNPGDLVLDAPVVMDTASGKKELKLRRLRL